MTPHNPVRVIVTLGPATRSKEALEAMRSRRVDFVRINMSHSSIEDLSYFIALAKEVDIPFILDTEGSQVRTGDLRESTLYLAEGDVIRLTGEAIKGDREALALKPPSIIAELDEGDIIHLDFDTLILRVLDTSTASKGFVTAQAVAQGFVGRNKAVIIDPGFPRTYDLPPLTSKDYEAIALGLREGVAHIAASFIRSRAYVDVVRSATKGTMKIISKIECVDGLRNLDEIIEASDYLLIDRGDLSKELPPERIPLLQKIIIGKARKKNKGTFIATNFLETMVEKGKPTRAEIHDIVESVLDGAAGLVLSAETAIGRHPLASVNVLTKVVRHVQETVDVSWSADQKRPLVSRIEANGYLLALEPSLNPPHGGVLVCRTASRPPDDKSLKSLPAVRLTEEQEMDVEQIALGTFSPIQGFLGKEDFLSVIDRMRLADDTIWPLPLLLDVDSETAAALPDQGDIVLHDRQGRPLAILALSEKYGIDDIDRAARAVFGTTDDAHPGVAALRRLKPVLLGGTVTLLVRRANPNRNYELTPAQARRLFAERGWQRIVGFHTRNAIHRGHEYIQLKALENTHADGLFVHPVIGKKKLGDFTTPVIIRSYELMTERFYPRNRVVFGVFSTFSRYAGPREALFTALCRKNFGCSHFIVGRDHTGVGNFYTPDASHRIFDRFPDIGIIPVPFGKVFYSPALGRHVEEGDPAALNADEIHISGTQVRALLDRGQAPPAWFMRPEIAQNILDTRARGDSVFVESSLAGG